MCPPATTFTFKINDDRMILFKFIVRFLLKHSEQNFLTLGMLEFLLQCSVLYPIHYASRTWKLRGLISQVSSQPKFS